jgi:hypothetical protein
VGNWGWARLERIAVLRLAGKAVVVLSSVKKCGVAAGGCHPGVPMSPPMTSSPLS